MPCPEVQLGRPHCHTRLSRLTTNYPPPPTFLFKQLSRIQSEEEQKKLEAEGVDSHQRESSSQNKKPRQAVSSTAAPAPATVGGPSSPKGFTKSGRGRGDGGGSGRGRGGAMTKRGNSWGRKAARQYSPIASARAGWKPRAEGEQGKSSPAVRIGSGTNVKSICTVFLTCTIND